MAIPALDADGNLPPGIHSATLDEIHEVFVVGAPFETERALIFTAMALHMHVSRDRLGAGPVVWVNGGFATHKTWAAPKDVDLAYVVPLALALRARQPDMMDLWTNQDVSAGQPMLVSDRVQPMAGLVDAFFIPEMPHSLAVWQHTWSRVKLEDGTIDPIKEKGFLEVIL